MHLLIWILIAIFAGVYITGPIIDPDLWWHITAGRWILAHADVPHVDYWNMFGVSLPWRAYSWSNEILFAFVDRLWGIDGLLYLKFLFAILLSVSLCYVFGRLSRDWFFGGLLGVYSTVATFSHFTLRPQSLTWIFLAWIILCADKISLKQAKSTTYLFLFLLIVFWSNSHLTTLLGIGTVLLWNIKRDSFSDSVVLSVKIVAFCLVATLFTPYFGGELLTFFSKVSHPLTYNTIAEFKAAQINHYATGFLVLLLTVFFLFLHMKPKLVEPAKIFLVVGYAIAGLAVVKFIPLAVIVASAVIATIWREYRDSPEALGKLGEGFGKLRAVYRSHLVGNGLAILIIALIIVKFSERESYKLSLEQTPVAAVDFIIDNNLPKPVLNVFGDGGYLMYRFSDANGNPSMLVPVDGRTNVDNHDVMLKHSAAVRGQLNWKEYLDIVKPETILWRTEGPLVAILKEREDWCQVFQVGTETKGHMVFVKSGHASCKN